MIVKGRVQGVGYRYFVRSYAIKHGIAGYVRNLSNGDVEIIAYAPTAEIEKLRHYCLTQKRDTHVASVDVEPIPHKPDINNFAICY